MNCILKKVYVIIFTLILILGVAFTPTDETSLPPYFLVQNEFGKENISIFDAQDGNFYVFLPSYADLEQVQVILPQDQTFLLDDILLTNQMTCENFELERPYSFSVDGQGVATLWFYQSQNVATMYLDTVSGEMTDIHNDKEHVEYASMTLYLPDGSLNHSDSSARLKGRGNSTWNLDKRPYLLKLSSDEDLLGMGSGKKWVLLANANDETNLNNKLVYDLASQVGFRWSPDSRYVDLYLNGEYYGLYLLTEKIEIHENRMDLDASAGDVLCEIELWGREAFLQRPFESSMGRLVEICYPENISNGLFDYITYLVYEMEKGMCENTDLVHSEILDLDSWVRRYLIDEISGNIDSDLTSSYFYYSDGKFYAGPIWDYDMAFGNSLRNQEPCAFIAKNRNKSYTSMSPYYSTLYANESFYQRLTEIYRTEFFPILQKMIQHDIDYLIHFISPASEMNSIRWRPMYDHWKESMEDLDVVLDSAALKSYFIRRIEFLNSAWLENKDYCTVQFESEPGALYWNISVEKGSCLETSYMNLADIVWVDMETEKPVDFHSPIMEDLVVKLQPTEVISTEVTPLKETVTDQTETEEPEENREFLSFWCLVVLLICFLLTDLSRKRNTGNRTKRSSINSLQ